VVTATPEPDPGEQLDEDQRLRFIIRSIGNYNPANEGGAGRFAISHIWMPLFLRDDQHNTEPWMAEGFDVSPDGKQYTMFINKQAVWSDGTPVTAQEAKEYWTWGLSKTQCVGCYLWMFTGLDPVLEGATAVVNDESDELTGVIAADDKTLVFNLTGPDPIFLQRLALFDMGWCKMEDVNTRPEGERFAASPDTRVNGPFKIKEWDTETKTHILEQNPNWWGAKKPTIKEMVVYPQPEENIMLVMWMNGEVDVAFFMSAIKEEIRRRTPEVFNLTPYPTNFFFRLNPLVPPMDDINVRKALNHAVDWPAVIHASWEGSLDDRYMRTIMTPELTCWKEGNWPDYGYDPDKAKEELAASKYGGPEGLPPIRITPGGITPTYVRTAEGMIEMWRQNLGIENAEMKPGGTSAWGQEADQVQVLRSSLGAIIPDEVNHLYGHQRWMASGDPPWYPDEELATMLEELQVMDRDDPAFCPGIQAAEARLLGHYHILPMVWERYEYLAKTWVKNFETNVDQNFKTLLDMYIVKDPDRTV
jgi:ABC-type transport system substrate-binding protein